MRNRSSRPILGKAMLQVDKLCSVYGNVQAVWDVSFHVEQGEIVAIIGTNGAGKTTILQSVVGLVSKTGRVTLEGNDITDVPAHCMAEPDIAPVPEGREVFPAMTVTDSLIVVTYTQRLRAPGSDASTS